MNNLDDEAPQELTAEEIWKINVRNLATLVANVIPDCIFMLTVIPDRKGQGMLCSHNVHIDNFEHFTEAQGNLAKSMCEAQANLADHNRTLN